MIKKFLNGSWQTTTLGLIILVAAILKHFEVVDESVFLLLLGVSGGGMGYVARDNGKSSEDVNAK